MIYGQRVEQAREFRLLTQTQLADDLGVSQVSIAYIENGRVQPSPEQIQALVASLKFSRTFFERPPTTHFGAGTLEFRAKSSLTAKQRKHAHQYAHIVFELSQLCAARLKMPSMRLPPKLTGGPEEAAAMVRAELGLPPNGPISNLTDSLERAGVFVFALPELVPGSMNGCDGFSVWGTFNDSLIPSIYVSASAPGDRQRLTIAHEIGELTLATLPPGKEREKIANRFAGALLMPEDGFVRDLTAPFSLYDFVELKKRYRVSIQAALVRAYHLKLIDQHRYHALYQQLSVRGWRKQEPEELAIPREKPRALHKMIELLYGGEQIDFVKIADELGFEYWFIPQLLAAHASKRDLSDRSHNPASAIVVPLTRRTADTGNALPICNKR